jgi:hypothetical protein
MKKVLGIHGNRNRHWVGDGFPVRTLFSYDSLGRYASPFLMLDYAGPAAFGPSEAPRGVGQHPHRGFETVTVVYQGELEHQDSSGGGGLIGPGDVQWMTAGAGILHEEFHAREFARRGGTLEMVQLWVNLPARHKMAAPRYQTLRSSGIPLVELPGEAGTLRVIAGDYEGHRGPALTFTAMDIWDVQLKAGRVLEIQLPPGRNASVVVLRGSLTINGSQAVREAQLALLDRSGSTVRLEASADATVLMLSGEPIDEPIAGYGPFVMNTAQEIEQAIQDLRSGRFGRIPATEVSAPA